MTQQSHSHRRGNTMKLQLSGVIYKDGKRVGTYGYSFTSCSFSYTINGFSEHFLHKEELIELLEKGGYTIANK